MKRGTAAAIIAGSAFFRPSATPADDGALVVGATASADAVPFFYAQSAGLFERAGITPKVQILGNGAAIAAAVAGGVADIGFSNVQTLVLARSKSIPFVILTPGGEYNDATPTTEMLVRSDATFHTAKELEGKIVAVGALHDLQSLSTQVWMAANDGDPTKVNFIETPASAALALLQQNRAQAIVVSEPNLHNAIGSGTARVFAKPFSALAHRLPVSAWFCTQNLLGSRSDAAKRFVEVMRHASDYVNAHADDMNALIGDYTKIPLATLHGMNHAKQGTVIDVVGLQLVIDASAKYHLIEKSFAAKDMIGA